MANNIFQSLFEFKSEIFNHKMRKVKQTTIKGYYVSAILNNGHLHIPDVLGCIHYGTKATLIYFFFYLKSILIKFN